MGRIVMKSYCQTCHVSINSSLKNCPVCGKFVQDVDPNIIERIYPTPDYKRLEKQSGSSNHHIFAFPLLLALFITLMIDLALITTQLGTTFLMTFIVFYLWVLIYKSIYNRQGIGYLILWQLLAISSGLTLLVFVQDRSFDRWPIQYVVPILISVSNLLFFILATVRRKTDVLLFQMFFSSLIGLFQFSFIFWLLNSRVVVPSLIAGITSLLSLLALFTFLRKKFWDYLQRWLHI